LNAEPRSELELALEDKWKFALGLPELEVEGPCPCLIRWPWAPSPIARDLAWIIQVRAGGSAPIF
jgi:hypothetical protein